MPITILLSTKWWIHWLDNAKTWNLMCSSSAQHQFTEYTTVNFTNMTLTGQHKNLKLNVHLVCPLPFYWAHDGEFYKQHGQCKRLKLNVLLVSPSPFYGVHNGEFYKQNTENCKNLKVNVLLVCQSPFYWAYNGEYIDWIMQNLET